LFHWLAISETHITVDAAIARQKDVKLEGWLNEWDVCNPDESSPEKRFRLFTMISELPRLVAAPDAAFILELVGYRKVFYLEQDRATSGVRQLAASKPPGYAAMSERRLHRRHFPATNVDTFTVLMVTTDQRRRDAVRKAFHGRPGCELWKFVAAADLKPETFLHEPILYPCEGAPVPLVKKSASQASGQS
jgi:hypothetical protein